MKLALAFTLTLFALDPAHSSSLESNLPQNATLSTRTLLVMDGLELEGAKSLVPIDTDLALGGVEKAAGGKLKSLITPKVFGWCFDALDAGLTLRDYNQCVNQEQETLKSCTQNVANIHNNCV
jgi:hypothetical protein